MDTATMAFSVSAALALGFVARGARAARRSGRSMHTGAAASGGLMAPPKVKLKEGKHVVVGYVEGENRGENPMKPPKVVYDPLYWLRDDERKDPDVIAHLEAENEYFESHTAKLKPLANELYKDFLSHIKETDESVPYPYGPYMYYNRTIEGQSYKIYCRKAIGSDKEEILLDMNALAKGKKHCSLGALVPSPDHNILAYAIDETGYETYKAYFLDLKTQKLIDEKLPEFTGNICWGKDNETLFYSTNDKAHRPYKLWKHVMGTDSKEDKVLFTEEDEEWYMGFGKTSSGRYLECGSGTSETSEIHVLDLEAGPDAPLTLVNPRKHGLKYSIDHLGEYFYITTNADGAKNQKLMRTKVDKLAKANWEEVRPYDEKITIDGVQCMSTKVIVEGRENGFACLWFLNLENNELEKISGFPEPVSTVGLGVNKNFDAKSVRIVYDSLVTPDTTYDVDLTTKKMTKVHVKTVPNYDSSLYNSKQITAEGHDGVKIPMAIVYRRDKYNPEKGGPVFLDGYGSYGICNEPSFASTYVSLLDRGVCVVQACIRGGGEMGRPWYEDHGKLLSKLNTFKDFISCAEHLIKENYTTSDKLAIHGRSAGGLLMGNVLNMAPHLFKCAIAAVPFVDLITTMSDASIPLTCGEWEEWGNPNEEKYYEYMKSYCPYTNVTAQDYPNIMVLAGLHDPRVAYWEPAKWVVRLRERKTDDNVVMLKTDLESGHFSASDRYKYLKAKSLEYAFVCDQIGASK